MKWSSECGEVQDELLVEVAESDKRSDHLDRLEQFPLFHSPELSGIHEYLSIFDYQSQVFHFYLIEGTLGQFEVEILSSCILSSTHLVHS